MTLPARTPATLLGVLLALLPLAINPAHAAAFPKQPPAKQWTDTSRNSGGAIVTARVGDSEIKLQPAVAAGGELIVPTGIKLVELTVDYKGRALWIVHNDGITYRSGLLDGVSTCLLTVGDLPRGYVIRLSVVGVVNGEAALLTGYRIIIGGKAPPGPVNPPVDPPGPINPPGPVNPPVDPDDDIPAPVLNAFEQALATDAEAKKADQTALNALESIYTSAASRPKESVASLYKWLGERYGTTAEIKGKLPALRVAINAELKARLTPLVRGTPLTDPEWADVVAELRLVAAAINKLDLGDAPAPPAPGNVLTGEVTAVFVADKASQSTAEAEVRSSPTLRKWLRDNGIAYKFLFTDNQYVKTKMADLVRQDGTPLVLLVNAQGQFKHFKMPAVEPDVIRAIKDRVGK
jgi:hypothetical protein